MYLYVYVIYICTCIGGFFFSKRAFHGGHFLQKNIFMRKLLCEIYGEGLLYMEELMIRSCQGRDNFRNAFSNNLNTVNLFSNHVEIFT